MIAREYNELERFPGEYVTLRGALVNRHSSLKSISLGEENIRACNQPGTGRPLYPENQQTRTQSQGLIGHRAIIQAELQD